MKRHCAGILGKTYVKWILCIFLDKFSNRYMRAILFSRLEDWERAFKSHIFGRKCLRQKYRQSATPRQSLKMKTK